MPTSARPRPRHYGSLATAKCAYRPLVTVEVRFGGRAAGDRQARIRVADTQQRVHFEREVALSNDYGDFDESKQIAMGNTWAITRGLGDLAQSASIVDEYRRRHNATGDAYAWWSLQPGYPDHLGYWKDPYRKQGAHANGGLMPWLGELERGALFSGRESYGVELLRQRAAHLEKTRGAQVRYWRRHARLPHDE